MRFRINVNTRCNTGQEQINSNIGQNSLMCYPKVKWGVAMYPPCAVVGGGMGLAEAIPILREWKGDIFAINDTAGYLSDRGIASYLFMIDPNDDDIRNGHLIKGAVLATRCNPKNFFSRHIRVYEMLEDNHKGGVEGGPTAACRAPHLFLRMGYTGVAFFGCDSCFYSATHITGEHKEAYDNMIVVRAGGLDFLTNVVFLNQAEFLAKAILKHPQYLYNCSGGLLKALVENFDTWEVVAVSDDIRKQNGKKGEEAFNSEYRIEKHKLWSPPASEVIDGNCSKYN